MSDPKLLNAIEALTQTLQQPVVPVRDVEGKIVGARREAPPPPPKDDWERTLDKWMAMWDASAAKAKAGKLSERELVSACHSIAMLVTTLAKANAKRRGEIEVLEAAVAALQTELRSKS